jgi:hypothetical protein
MSAFDDPLRYMYARPTYDPRLRQMASGTPEDQAAYLQSAEWQARQMNQRAVFNPRYQARIYNYAVDAPTDPALGLAKRKAKEAADLEEARKRMDERLGIEALDLSWLDEGQKPLRDR